MSSNGTKAEVRNLNFMGKVTWRRKILSGTNLTRMKRNETVVTRNGTTTIPQDIRRSCGIEPGAVLIWTVRHGVIEARKKAGVPNVVQRHIHARAGAWDGKLSGEELLRKTRP
jgi:bifunctional DNA-binding transcriptional regulator/antitoxin component of YhaV-PrlF toxin-antitoxin module